MQKAVYAQQQYHRQIGGDKQEGFSDHSLMQKLMAQSWLGTVRELRNVAERFVLGIRQNVIPFLYRVK